MHKKGFLHSLLMMACCILPVVALLIYLPQIKNAVSGLNWSWVLLLVCPLIHILMMIGIMGSKGCRGGEDKKKVTDKTELAGE